VNWLSLAAEMRAAGVRRLVLSEPQAEIHGFSEVELEPAHPDTVPAPALDFEPEAEEKPAGTCSVGGCQERAGFHFAPHLCERHGLSQLGVKT